MLGGPYDIDLNRLPAGPVRRASMLLSLWLTRRAGGGDLVHRLVVVDADARVPALLAFPPRGDTDRWSVHALGPDGRYLVASRRGRGDLVRYELATGACRPLAVGGTPGRAAVRAAVAPDGATIAVLSGAPTELWRIDIDGSECERLWWAPTTPGATAATHCSDAPDAGGRARDAGGGAPEAGVGWSPDGRLVAATYRGAGDRPRTVVLDACGDVRADVDDLAMVPGGNHAWLGTRLLVGRAGPARAYRPGMLLVVDLDTGTRRALGTVPGDDAHRALLVDPGPQPPGRRRFLGVTGGRVDPLPALTIRGDAVLEWADWTHPGGYAARA